MKQDTSGILGRRRATALQQREDARDVAATPRDAASIIVAIPPILHFFRRDEAGAPIPREGRRLVQLPQ
jgi:hypothetical protein